MSEVHNQSSFVRTIRLGALRRRTDVCRRKNRAFRLRKLLAITILMLLAIVRQTEAARTTPLRGTPTDRLFDLVKVRGRIAIIVGARDDEWRPEGLLRAEEVSAQRQRIRGKKAGLVGKHSNVKMVAGREFDTIPFFLTMVTEGTLRQLLDDDLVDSVEEDSEGELSLVQSTSTVGATELHTRQRPYTGSGQIIVVIDSGVDDAHEFFGAPSRILRGDSACFSGPWETNNGDPVSTYESICPNGQHTQIADGAAVPCVIGDMTNPVNRCHHGTRVTGVAAGKNMSMSGVAPGAKVIPIQVVSEKCDAFGCAKTLKSDVIAALNDVTNRLLPLHGRKIAAVSMSIGFPPRHSSRTACDTATPAMKGAIDNLLTHDVAVIAATGNDFITSSISTPACITGVIAVSATTDGDAVPEYANTAGIMDLFAPGGSPGTGLGIYTSQNTGCTNCALYFEDHGTSMAAPHVAGAFALLRERSPQASIQTLLQHLIQTGVPVTDIRAGGSVQKPRIKIDAALDLAQTPGAPSQLVATGTSTASIQLTWSAPQPSVPNATYRIRVRSNAASAWTEVVGAHPAASFLHSNLARGTVFQYEVATRNELAVLSDPVFEYAVTRPFTDDPMNAPHQNGGRPIKGIFISELREAADAWRSFAPTALPAAFSDYDVAVPGLLRASHLNEITAALNEARQAIEGLSTFVYVDVAPPAAGVVIDRRHVEQLRRVMQ